MADPDPSAEQVKRYPSRELWVILAVALLARLLRIALWAPVVEEDGAEYCRLAENILSGRGYVGMISGPELMLPPLFPVLIAMVKAATGCATVAAGRAISLVAGLGLVALLHRLVYRVAGARAARIAATLAALGPACVLASTAVFAEGLQLCLLTGGILFAVRCVESRGIAPALVAGILFGLSYLARVESFLLGMLAFVILLAGYPRPAAPTRRPLLPALCFLLTFAFAMSPYPWYLKQATGEWRLEGKSERVAASVARADPDLDYGEINYALGPQGEELGPWLAPSAILDGPGLPAAVLDDPTGALGIIARNSLELGLMLVSGHTLMSMLFLACFVFAWIARKRSRGARFLDIYLLALFVLVAGLGCLYKVVLRYFAALALPTIIWGARGLDTVLRAGAERFPARRLRLIEILATAALLISVWRGALTGFREYDECGPPHRGVQTLGAEIGGTSIEGAVMGDDSRIAYYSGRDWLPLPAAPRWDLVRERAHRLNAAFLNLSVPAGGGPPIRPGPWFDPEAPPEGLTLVGRAGTIFLYRLEPR